MRQECIATTTPCCKQLRPLPIGMHPSVALQRWACPAVLRPDGSDHLVWERHCTKADMACPACVPLWFAALIAVEGKLAEYGKVLQAMRSRILALQVSMSVRQATGLHKGRYSTWQAKGLMGYVEGRGACACATT
jgi:hypothetical protein